MSADNTNHQSRPQGRARPMYFDLRTYLRVLRLALTDKPSPRRLFVHLLVLSLLPVWALTNLVCMQLDKIFFPAYRDTPVREPVFIIGNARSGTTLFHRLLSGDESRFAYFRTWEILFPALVQRKVIVTLVSAYQRAFPRSFERLVEWEKRQLQTLKKIRPIGVNEPDEDEFLMLVSFASPVLAVLFPYADELADLAYFDGRPLAARERVMSYYRECVLRHLAFHGGGRTLLSKNPAFVTKIRGLAREFPDSKFIYLVREPSETIPSLLKLMSTVWEGLGLDSKHIEGATRQLGNGCIRDYRYAMEALSELPADRYAILEYTDLVGDPKAAVEKVYERLGLSVSSEFTQRLGTARKRQQSYKSVNVYSMEEFGFSTAEVSRELSDVMERFGVSPIEVHSRDCEKSQDSSGHPTP